MSGPWRAPNLGGLSLSSVQHSPPDTSATTGVDESAVSPFASNTGLSRGVSTKVASTSRSMARPPYQNGHQHQPKASTSNVTTPPYSIPTLVSSSNYGHAYDIAMYLQGSFIPSITPSEAEYDAKEKARLSLEHLADRVSPGAKLLPFGSMANGFALKNSDMDLCCFLHNDAPVRTPPELVELLGRLIEQETVYQVKMLPRARIPIIKLTMPPSEEVPFGMACDIGFENRLALENTRLLLTYAMVDSRLRTLVLFLKVWTKRRKINSPYRGTLSSYGYVLLVIHFLVHVKLPPVLPNLQQIPLSRASTAEELVHDGHNIEFFDDLAKLPEYWRTANTDNVGELLIEFFKYFSKEFMYNSHVISIRSEDGILSKEAKGWHTDSDYDPDAIFRDLHKLCIEDPFQLDYNVARTVTRDGLYTIRGEFMRAFRLLSGKPLDSISTLINILCEERDDCLVHHPPVEARSPRRRSAPSPRMTAMRNPPPLPTNVADFRIWAAMNTKERAAEMSTIDAMPNGNGAFGLASSEPFVDLRAAKFTNGFSQHQGHSVSHSRRPIAHGPAFNNSQSLSAPHSLRSIERRISWDGSAASTSKITTGIASVDFHRPSQDLKFNRHSHVSPMLLHQEELLPSAPATSALQSSVSVSSSPAEQPSVRSGPHQCYSDGGGEQDIVDSRLEHSGSSNSITFGTFPSWSQSPKENGSQDTCPSCATSFPHGSIAVTHSSRRSTSAGLQIPGAGADRNQKCDPEGDRRGRRLQGTDFDNISNQNFDELEDLEMRPRGRSIPHLRPGTDGRQEILFGEIAAILPSFSHVTETADYEDEDKQLKEPKEAEKTTGESFQDGLSCHGLPTASESELSIGSDLMENDNELTLTSPVTADQSKNTSSLLTKDSKKINGVGTPLIDENKTIASPSALITPKLPSTTPEVSSSSNATKSPIAEANDLADGTRTSASSDSPDPAPAPGIAKSDLKGSKMNSSTSSQLSQSTKVTSTPSPSMLSWAEAVRSSGKVSSSSSPTLDSGAGRKTSIGRV